MQRLINGLLCSLLATVLAGCETTEVQKVVPAEAPVSFSTYAWGVAPLGDVPDASAQNVELDEELRQIVRAYLHRRGYRLVEGPEATDRADMVLDYQVSIVEQEVASEESAPGWDAQFDSNAPRGTVELPSRSGAPRVILTLEIGRTKGAAIWGGSASKILGSPEDAAERQELLGVAVQEILKDLPPAAGY